MASMLGVFFVPLFEVFSIGQLVSVVDVVTATHLRTRRVS